MSRWDPVLERQLQRAGLEDVTHPSPEQYHDLLERLSAAFARAGEQRDQLTRLAELGRENLDRVSREEARLASAVTLGCEGLDGLMARARRIPADPEALAAERKRWVDRMTAALEADDRLDAESPSRRALRHLRATLVEASKLLLPPSGGTGPEAIRAAGMLQPAGDPPPHAGVTVSGSSEPVGPYGGDFWAAWPLGDQRVVVLVGDATGHGAEALVVAASARAAADGVRRSGTVDLGALFRAMNDAVLATAHGRLLLTCAATLFDVERRTLEVRNAGHCLPLLLREREIQAIVARGSPLGGAPDPDCEPITIPLRDHDLVALYTDGLLDGDAPGGERSTERWLRNALTGHYDVDPRVMRDRLLVELRAARSDQPRSDDQTFALARVALPPEAEWSSIP